MTQFGVRYLRGYGGVYEALYNISRLLQISNYVSMTGGIKKKNKRTNKKRNHVSPPLDKGISAQKHRFTVMCINPSKLLISHRLLSTLWGRMGRKCNKEEEFRLQSITSPATYTCQGWEREGASL